MLPMTANSVAPISDCPREQYQARVHVLPHIKGLDDCFGQFLVRVICDCGACREIEPEALACLVGWKVTLRELALRLRCSRCGKKAAEVVAVATSKAPLILTAPLRTCRAPPIAGRQQSGHPVPITHRPTPNGQSRGECAAR